MTPTAIILFCSPNNSAGWHYAHVTEEEIEPYEALLGQLVTRGWVVSEELCLAHRAGGLRGWHWHWLGTGENLRVDYIVMGCCACAGGSACGERKFPPTREAPPMGPPTRPRLLKVPPHHLLHQHTELSFLLSNPWKLHPNRSTFLRYQRPKAA